MADLLRNCDVTFTSNITSAAVDAYCLGVPVIQKLDGNEFNMSPLRGLDNVVYVRNSVELATALSKTKQHKLAVTVPYFCLDNTLSRWRDVLDLIPK